LKERNWDWHAGCMCATAKTNEQATTVKTGSMRRDFGGLDQRRLDATRLFAHGATQTASTWYRRWHDGGGAGRAAGRAAARGCRRRT
jgi:hypothetical protein